MKNHDRGIDGQVAAFLEEEAVSEIVQGWCEPLRGAANQGGVSRRAERCERFGLLLLILTPIVMGCAVYLPAWELFRWVGFGLGVLCAVLSIWNLNRADLG